MMAYEIAVAGMSVVALGLLQCRMTPQLMQRLPALARKGYDDCGKVPQAPGR